MMKKCALQITYRSMHFLILPYALDNSKSQFIACYLMFHKLRDVLWTVKKPQPNIIFYSGVLGEEKKKGRKSGCFSKSNRIGFNG